MPIPFVTAFQIADVAYIVTHTDESRQITVSVDAEPCNQGTGFEVRRTGIDPFTEENVKTFDDDDQGFRMWQNRNNNGYVVNAHNNPTSVPMVLHTARCRDIRVLGKKYTSGDYFKVCSPSKDEVEIWARQQEGAELRYCKHCGPV